MRTSRRTSPGRREESRGGKRSVSERPTMSRMMRSSVTSPARVVSVETTSPSRITVIVSATRLTSFSLCEMRIEEMPFALNSRRRSRSAAESASFSEEVGSSRMRSFTSFASAFAISTSCCLPSPRSPTKVRGLSFSPTRARSAPVRR